MIDLIREVRLMNKNQLEALKMVIELRENNLDKNNIVNLSDYKKKKPTPIKK